MVGKVADDASRLDDSATCEAVQAVDDDVVDLTAAYGCEERLEAGACGLGVIPAGTDVLEVVDEIPAAGGAERAGGVALGLG